MNKHCTTTASGCSYGWVALMHPLPPPPCTIPITFCPRDGRQSPICQQLLP